MKNGIYSTQESYPDKFVQVAAVVNNLVVDSWSHQIDGNGSIRSAAIGKALPSTHKIYRRFTSDESKRYEH